MHDINCNSIITFEASKRLKTHAFPERDKKGKFKKAKEPSNPQVSGEFMFKGPLAVWTTADVPLVNQGDCWYAEYFGIDLIEDIRNGELHSEDYLDQIIFSYMNGTLTDIDTDTLITYMFNEDVRTFLYIPIILYILTQEYQKFFNQNQPVEV
jgi:hypothetical protein